MNEKVHYVITNSDWDKNFDDVSSELCQLECKSHAYYLKVHPFFSLVNVFILNIQNLHVVLIGFDI